MFKPLTSPNARLVNATIAHMDSASLRWIKTVDLSKRVMRGHSSTNIAPSESPNKPKRMIFEAPLA